MPQVCHSHETYPRGGRERESSNTLRHWMPACAGMTEGKIRLKNIGVSNLQISDIVSPLRDSICLLSPPSLSNPPSIH